MRCGVANWGGHPDAGREHTGGMQNGRLQTVVERDGSSQLTRKRFRVEFQEKHQLEGHSCLLDAIKCGQEIIYAGISPAVHKANT